MSAGAAGAKDGQGDTGHGRVRLAGLKLALMVAGYIVAVVAATVVTVALLFAPVAASSGSLAAARFAVTDAPAIMIVGFFWTFLCALPGFVVAMALGERQAWRRWHSYAFAGFLDVVPSFLIFGGFTGSLLGMADVILCALPGGLVGGVAYWASFGRLVAARRRPT